MDLISPKVQPEGYCELGQFELLDVKYEIVYVSPFCSTIEMGKFADAGEAGVPIIGPQLWELLQSEGISRAYCE